MNFLMSFIISGTICAIGQIIFDKTKFTPGHIVSIYVVFGSVLSFFGVYDYLISIAPGGSSCLILNFGHLLYSSSYEGLIKGGILGALLGMFDKCSATLTVTILSAFIASLIKKHE